MSAPPSSGAILGRRYRLDRELGRGATGVVWAAVDVERNEPRAVKVLQSDQRGADARFEREARALLSLDHPGIVDVTDLVEDGGRVTAIVMEQLEGTTLRHRLAAGPLGVGSSAGVLASVAEAVLFAHSKGVMHRDLKPENVFLCTDGRTVVLDFGLTRRLGGEGEARTVLTEHGARLGTLPYMAPEQLIDASQVDAEVDAWALGVILHECLAGFRPFEGQSEPELVHRILTGALVPLTFVAADVPEALSTLVGRLLERDPRDRRAALSAGLSALRSHAHGGH